MTTMEETSLQFSAGELTPVILRETERWTKEKKVAQLWQGKTSLWTHDNEDQWLGWLDVTRENNEIAAIEKLAKDIKQAGFEHILLMGMGGSSLCPAMLAEIFGKLPEYPQLHILDSTDPQQIIDLEKVINLQKTFFIVSSKSGNTLEPTIFKDYFFSKVPDSQRFIAITDPRTSLDKLAHQEKFKAVFYGVPSIGGRYSALSNFGMVPARLMGIDIKRFLANAKVMQEACKNGEADKNPGVLLGVILGVCAQNKKDKITLVTSPSIHSLGSWLEQLLAESTGKEGKGLIPVDQEALGSPSVYRNDRVFVYIRLETAANSDQDRKISALEEAGFVVVTINFMDILHLGAELFRWEIATAVAGSILCINPFNQPDVEESKVLTLTLTKEYEQTGHLTKQDPFFDDQGVLLYADDKSQKYFAEHLGEKRSVESYLTTFLSQAHKNDYVTLSAFITMSTQHLESLQKSRVIIRDRTKLATCLGFGPRFLHSTGQLYKGGTNSGIFLQITTDYENDISIPGHRYTFGLVITAQAQADFSVLVKRNRRVLRLHFKHIRNGLHQLQEMLRCLDLPYFEV